VGSGDATGAGSEAANDLVDAGGESGVKGCKGEWLLPLCRSVLIVVEALAETDAKEMEDLFPGPLDRPDLSTGEASSSFSFSAALSEKYCSAFSPVHACPCRSMCSERLPPDWMASRVAFSRLARLHTLGEATGG
jgi:hypothetical protein